MAWSSSASFAEVFAICISESPASIMRAPPDLEIMRKGVLVLRAWSIALEIFSPTTEPIDPPIKLKSIQAMTISRPSIFPYALRTASFRLALACDSLMRLG